MTMACSEKVKGSENVNGGGKVSGETEACSENVNGARR